MTTDSPSHPTEALSFKVLKMRAGLALQVQPSDATGRAQDAQFLAAVGQKGIMLGPFRSDEKIHLTVGVEYLVKGFNGQYDFSFRSKVVQNFEQPFAYALMAYPESVNARLVRSAMRIKTSLPATATPAGQSQAQDITVIDLSHSGAMVHSPIPLGGFGDVVNLSLPFEFENEPINLLIPSIICHSYKREEGVGVNVGLAFKPNSRDDKLMLHLLAVSASDR